METPTFQYPSYTYRAKVTRVIDGDTVDVRLDVGFKTHLFKRIRFLGIDTWELRGEEYDSGVLAKARLEELIEQADEIYVQTIMDGEGKYGRVLGWLWLENTGGVISANQILLEEGHGKEYIS